MKIWNRSTKPLYLAIIALIVAASPVIVNKLLERLIPLKYFGWLMSAIYFGPTLGAVIGIVAIISAILFLRRRKNVAPESSKTPAVTGLVLGGLVILIGALWSVAVAVLFIAEKPKPNHPFGRWEIHHYGEPGYSENGFQVILLSDSTLLTIANRTPEGVAQNAPHEAFLLHTGRNGEELWRKIIGGGGGRIVAAPIPRGIMVAHLMPPADGDSTNKTDISMTLMSLDGEEIGTKSYDFGMRELLYDLIPAADGNLLLLAAAGTAVTRPRLTKESPDEPDTVRVLETLVMKLTPSGDSLWARTYPPPRSGWMENILELRDGSIMLSGLLMYLDQDGGTKKYELYLMKLDSAGNFLWNNTARERPHVAPTGMVEMNDGSILIVGDFDDKTQAGSVVFEGHFIKVSQDGEIVWDKPFGTGNSNQVWEMLPWTNGTVLAIGSAPINLAPYRLKFDFWDTFFIAQFDTAAGTIRHFHGVRERFEPLDAALVGSGHCVLVGPAERANPDGARHSRLYDIALMDYYSTDDSTK